MSRLLKIAASLIVLSSLTACTVIPPQVAYTGPSVGIVTVGPHPITGVPAGTMLRLHTDTATGMAMATATGMAIATGDRRRKRLARSPA